MSWKAPVSGSLSQGQLISRSLANLLSCSQVTVLLWAVKSICKHAQPLLTCTTKGKLSGMVSPDKVCLYNIRHTHTLKVNFENALLHRKDWIFLQCSRSLKVFLHGKYGDKGLLHRHITLSTYIWEYCIKIDLNQNLFFKSMKKRTVFLTSDTCAQRCQHEGFFFHWDYPCTKKMYWISAYQKAQVILILAVNSTVAAVRYTLMGSNIFLYIRHQCHADY